jgi:Nucleotidyl transferase AbiEii toxin, Type IV TA system
MREICAISHDQDGLAYSLATMTVEPIRVADQYHGFRILLDVLLAGAKIPFQIDIGFGDAIVPDPIDVNYPTLLDDVAPNIRTYPREAVIAEKLHAMVTHGEGNSRYKDFYDVFVLSTRCAFPGATLTSAIQATFTRRQTPKLDPWPVALTIAFYTMPGAASSGYAICSARSSALMLPLTSRSSASGCRRSSIRCCARQDTNMRSRRYGHLADHGGDPV